MSETWHPGVKVAELSHVGMRRANNQDSLAVMVAKSAERLENRGHLFVVADGMGAHAAGELASKIASERIAMHYYRSQQTGVDMALVDAVHQANDAIFERGQSNPEFHNMGTTASSMIMAGGQAYVAHVGDSRVYRLRGGTLEQLTFDHSLVWEMEASGHVHRDSPFGSSIPKNVITRSLGPAADVQVDLEGPFDLQVGDRFLLCSDGLTGLVEDDELAVLLDCLEVETAAAVMIDLANLRGGPDNITVIIVEVDGSHITEIPGGKRAGRGKASGGSFDVARALLVMVAVCWLVAIGLGVAVAMGSSSLLAPAIVAFVLGAIAAGLWGTGVLQPNQSRRKPGSAGQGGGGNSLEMSVGTGPYRRYDASGHEPLYSSLNKIIGELRETSEKNHWMLDWSRVNQLSKDAEQAANAKKWKDAIRRQCDATLEAMAQLRKHQDDSASDTAVDP